MVRDRYIVYGSVIESIEFINYLLAIQLTISPGLALIKMLQIFFLPKSKWVLFVRERIMAPSPEKINSNNNTFVGAQSYA